MTSEMILGSRREEGLGGWEEEELGKRVLVLDWDSMSDEKRSFEGGSSELVRDLGRRFGGVGRRERERRLEIQWDMESELLLVLWSGKAVVSEEES